VRIGETILARLRFSGGDTAQILSLVANHMRFGDVLQMKQSTLKRFLRLPRFDEHLALHRLDASAAHGDLTCYNFARAHFEAEPTPDLRPAPLLTGRDLIAAATVPPRSSNPCSRSPRTPSSKAPQPLAKKPSPWSRQAIRALPRIPPAQIDDLQLRRPALLTARTPHYAAAATSTPRFRLGKDGLAATHLCRPAQSYSSLLSFSGSTTMLLTTTDPIPPPLATRNRHTAQSPT